MSVAFVHFNSDIFDDPLAFNPDRWLEDRGNKDNLDVWLVPFSRGTRMCLGIKYAFQISACVSGCRIYLFLFAQPCMGRALSDFRQSASKV